MIYIYTFGVKYSHLLHLSNIQSSLIKLRRQYLLSIGTNASLAPTAVVETITPHRAFHLEN